VAVPNAPARQSEILRIAGEHRFTAATASALPLKESKMPKMKTKAAAKKRFRFTANGRVKAGPAGKRHGMIKRSNDFLRNTSGTMILSKPDERIVKIYMPYNR
jgi:large subunit ribosomal protein L35